ncbi:SLBB domain-containing protein [Anseongella ginsenosidimutans]|uniref:SLBB domain-containing protein n=1 Tax=Anseongella ginsenosidimutans TaxID=496056 RepID=UPI0011CA2144|nr:SLBB domain-containing protein [Anseongella ginsenosidimutans]QEC52106.1 capsule biosynthesis protein [Anseongella ginsenosidimutans]
MTAKNIRYCRLIRQYICFIVLSLGLAVALLQPAQGQTLPLQDLSEVNVDELSDAQVRQFVMQAQESGLSVQELEQAALQRGMPPGQISKLRERIDQLGLAAASASRSKTDTGPATEFSRGFGQDTAGYTNPASRFNRIALAFRNLTPEIFGQQLFNNPNLTFAPDLNLPTPAGYQLGPGDELNIDIYGYSDVTHQVRVSPDGFIRIPNLGPIQVNGLSIEEARSRIRTQLTKIYGSIRSGETSVQITLSDIRSIRVTIIGEANLPGTYTISSLATAFNALYASGGPNESGSFRDIEVIRNNEVIAHIDIYDFLIRGANAANVRLQDQDVIKINPYQTRVQIKGEVKRPAIFEALPGETLARLLEFAGGFTQDAYTGRIVVVRNANGQKSIADVAAGQYDSFELQLGDVYTVDEILDRYTNRIQITGAVFRPGTYALEPGITVKQLIEKAAGLREDAFLNRANIYRVGENLEPRLLSFDLGGVMSGSAADIPLQREDSLHIASRFDLREEYHVIISGAVQQPDTFAYSGNMNLEALIVMAGGFTEAATPNRVEISRRVRNADPEAANPATAQIYSFDINRDLSSSPEAADFALQPFDQVFVRVEPGYEVQKNISVEGEVLYPGTYSTANKNDRISDIIERAGGLLPDAYVEGAVLIRKEEMDVEAKLELEELKAKQRQNQLAAGGAAGSLDTSKDQLMIDSLEQAIASKRPNLVNIDLEAILESPGSKHDLIAQEGDVIRIPRLLQTVKVGGEVLYPKTVRFEKGISFKRYVSQAGALGRTRLKEGLMWCMRMAAYEVPGSFYFLIIILKLSRDQNWSCL